MHFHIKNIPDYITNTSYYWKHYQYLRETARAQKRGLQYGLVRGGRETYVHRIDDYTIPHEMFISKQTWSEKEMRLFFRLSAKYYGIKPRSGGYFLDIGANIGTTSIWVSRNIRPQMQVISFEPDPANYQLLEINRILNACTEMTIENLALSDKQGTAGLVTCSGNSGQSRIVTDGLSGNGQKASVVRTVRLDEYLRERNIEPQQIQYIWIDTEGHEPFVLAGMTGLLQKKKIPVFMEFSPDMMDEKNFVVLYQSLKPVYSRCVAFRANDGHMRDMDIVSLPHLYQKAREQYNLFLY